MADFVSQITGGADTREKRQYSAWTRSKQQPVLIILLAVIVLGYLVFFFSPLYVKKTVKDEDITLSKLGESMNDDTDGRTLTIDTWTYCPEQNAMEMKLVVSNTTFDGKDKYQFNAQTDGNDKPEVTQLVADRDFIVLRITNLPEKWNFLCVRMFMPGVSMRNKDNAMFKLYTSMDTVGKVKSLPQKTSNQYRAEYLQEQIDGLNQDLADLQKQKEADKQALDGYNKSEASIRKELEIATDDETADLNEQLKELDAARATTKSDIANVEASMTDKRRQIANYQTVRDTYLGRVPAGVNPN